MRSKPSWRPAAGQIRLSAKRRAPQPSGTPPGPRWLVGLLGVDFFADATSVTIGTPQPEAILAHVGQLQRWSDGRTFDVRHRRWAGTPRAVCGHLLLLSCLGTPDTYRRRPGSTGSVWATLGALDRGPHGHPKASVWLHLAGLKRLGFLVHSQRDRRRLAESSSRLTGLRRLFISLPKVTDTALARPSCSTRLEELAFGGETEATLSWLISGLLEPQYPPGVWAVVHGRWAGPGVGDGPPLDLLRVRRHERDRWRVEPPPAAAAHAADRRQRDGASCPARLDLGRRGRARGRYIPTWLR